MLCVLCVGNFGVGVWGVSDSCLCESLVWVWGSQIVLSLGQFFVGL